MTFKLKLTIRRVMCAVLISLVLLFNIEIKPVMASSVVVIAGIAITSEVLAYFASLMAAAGITYIGMEELTNAVSYMASSNPDAFRRMIEPLATKAGEVVSFTVSALRNMFTDVSEYFGRFFTKEGDTATLSTANAVDVVEYYEGYPIMELDVNTWGPVYYMGSCPTINLNLPTDKQKYDAFMNSSERIGSYSLGESLSNGIGGIGGYYEISDGVFKVYKVDVNGVRVEVYRSKYSGDNMSYLYDGRTFIYVKGSNGKYGLYFFNNYVVRSTDAFGEIRYDGRVELSSYLHLVHFFGTLEDIVVPNFTANISSSNVMDDTTDFSMTLGAVSDVSGRTLDDTDTVELKILDNPVGITVGDVVVPVTGEVDVPDVPIDVPIENAGELDYSGLKMNLDMMASVFPFCIPFDFINAIKSMIAPPETPVFKIDFNGTVFGDYVWELNMSDFESLAVIMRWGLFLGFIVALMMNTGRFIKW